MRIPTILMMAALAIPSAHAVTVTPEIKAALAPTGKLRIAVSSISPLDSKKDANGALTGMAVDLAGELAKAVGVPVEITGLATLSEQNEILKATNWDVLFIDSSPERAMLINFSNDYIDSEVTYMVSKESTIKTIADLDKEGVSIAVLEKSSIDKELSSVIKKAKIVRVPGAAADVFKHFADNKLDAIASQKIAQIGFIEKMPGARILDGNIMVLHKAVGTPKDRPLATKFICEFTEEMKASGLVAKTMEKNGVKVLKVSPKAECGK